MEFNFEFFEQNVSRNNKVIVLTDDEQNICSMQDTESLEVCKHMFNVSIYYSHKMPNISLYEFSRIASDKLTAQYELQPNAEYTAIITQGNQSLFHRAPFRKPLQMVWLQLWPQMQDV